MINFWLILAIVALVAFTFWRIRLPVTCVEPVGTPDVSFQGGIAEQLEVAGAIEYDESYYTHWTRLGCSDHAI